MRERGTRAWLVLVSGQKMMKGQVLGSEDKISFFLAIQVKLKSCGYVKFLNENQVIEARKF